MISPCVLLIDNDVKLLAKLEPVLRRAGYRVLTATDGRQGLYLAQAALPEVIVCDRTMPSQSDSDLRRTLAQDSRTASIPFVDLPKPLDKQELVARVNEVIRSHAFG
ncbi:MAG: response regulator [Anaerolineales bacterium]